MTSVRTAKTSPIAVVGPGAVGGLLAALLQRAGHDVVLVGRPATAQHITEHGLEIVTDRFGTWHAPLTATTSVPHGASVLLAVKAEGVTEVVGPIAAARPREVVPLLNGIEHMVVLRTALGDRSDGGTIVAGSSYAGETLRTGARSHEAMTVRHRGDLLRITVPQVAAGLDVVGALRDTPVDLVTGGTETEVLWAKLRFLAPLALLTSAHEAGIGAAMDADPGLVDGVLGEVSAVASAEGVPTTTDDLAAILRGFPPTMRSSLQADLAAGHRGEIDAIGGAVVRRGRVHRVATPTVEAVVARLGAGVA